MKRKIISALLALCMVLSMVPFAGATDAETPSGGGPVKLDKAPEILPATLGDTANVVPQEELMNGYDVTFVGGAGTKADPYLYNMEHPGLRAHANAQQPAVVDYWVGIFLPIEIDKQLENGSQGGSPSLKSRRASWAAPWATAASPSAGSPPRAWMRSRRCWKPARPTACIDEEVRNDEQTHPGHHHGRPLRQRP